MLHTLTLTATPTIGPVLLGPMNREHAYLQLWISLTNRVAEMMALAWPKEGEKGDTEEYTKLWGFWKWAKAQTSRIEINR